MSTMREQFEAFWRREMNTEVMDLCRTEYPMTAPEDQQYKCHETNRAWMTWQAAMSSRQQGTTHRITVSQDYVQEMRGAAEKVVKEILPIPLADVTPALADAERFRYTYAITKAAADGDELARRVILAHDKPCESIEELRSDIDAMRAEWQPLNWD